MYCQIHNLCFYIISHIKKNRSVSVRLTDSQPGFLGLQVSIEVGGQAYVRNAGRFSLVVVIFPVAVPDPCEKPPGPVRNLDRIYTYNQTQRLKGCTYTKLHPKTSVLGVQHDFYVRKKGFKMKDFRQSLYRMLQQPALR